MLSVLMKYDFKRLWRLMTILCAVDVGSTLLLRALFAAINNINDPTGFSDVAAVLMIISLLIVIAVAPTIMLVFSFVHFYKNLVTDEGYLTFTLPTTPTKILASKFIVSALCLGAVSIVSMLGFVFCGWEIVMSSSFGDLLRVLSGMVSYFVTDMGVGVFGVVLLVLSTIVSGCFSIMSIFFSIVLGSTFSQKNKLPMSILCYFGIQFVTGFLSNLVAIFGMIGFDYSFNFGMNATSLFSLALNAILTVVFFFVSKELLTKKLNLQ